MTHKSGIKTLNVQALVPVDLNHDELMRRRMAHQIIDEMPIDVINQLFNMVKTRDVGWSDGNAQQRKNWAYNAKFCYEFDAENNLIIHIKK